MRGSVLFVLVAGILAGCADEAGSASVLVRDFVELGTGAAVARIDEAVWTDSEEAAALGDELTDIAEAGELDDDVLDQALGALEQEPEGGTRGAAFFLAGCAETGAALRIDGSVITAVPTGGENVNCDVAVNFMAVFDIPEDDIPDGARLG